MLLNQSGSASDAAWPAAASAVLAVRRGGASWTPHQRPLHGLRAGPAPARQADRQPGPADLARHRTPSGRPTNGPGSGWSVLIRRSGALRTLRRVTHRPRRPGVSRQPSGSRRNRGQTQPEPGQEHESEPQPEPRPESDRTRGGAEAGGGPVVPRQRHTR